MNADMQAGTGEAKDGGPGRETPRRIAAWAGVTALMLLVPLVAMQVTGDVAWSPIDFATAGALLFGSGLTYELVARRMESTTYRAAVGIAVAAALLLVWINLAVGIIGSEDNAANLMYFGVLAVGIIGALVARFEPRGMARALSAAALALVLIAVIVLLAGLESPRQVVALNGFFAALCIVSAGLFRKAARGSPSR